MYPRREAFMQKKWNIIAILAVLLFASVAVAADETKPGAVPGYKFCMKRVSGVWTLSQQPESHEADYWSSESCYDLWYDADHHTSSELVHANSYYDAYSEVSIRLSDGDLVKLGSDLDFGGMNADNSACVAAFRPLAGLKGLVFNGDNHTIKNLCFIQKKTDLITTNIGFFSKVEGADAGVTDITFENVYFQTSYGPVAGVVAGMVTGASSFSNITLKNVKVDAATAGGVVGECGENVNSKGRPVFKNIVGKKVEVLTSTNVVPAYDYEYNGSIYEIYLGGLVGNASWGISVTDVSITDLNVHSEVYSIEMIYFLLYNIKNIPA